MIVVVKASKDVTAPVRATRRATARYNLIEEVCAHVVTGGLISDIVKLLLWAVSKTRLPYSTVSPGKGEGD